jgi:hypothetical protein
VKAKIFTSLLLVLLLLGAILPSFVTPQTVYAATETLRPNAAGDETNIPSSNGCTYHWQCVDDVTPDEDATEVHNTLGDATFRKDLYNLPAHSGSGTINHIKVYARAKSAPYNGYYTGLQIWLKTGGTAYVGSEITLTTSYATYSYQWSGNPQTGLDWTWADIDALQIGIAVRDSGYGYQLYSVCTQVYVEIDYTPSGAPTVVTNAASSIEETTATTNGEVTVVNDTNITERGFVWDTSTHGDPGDTDPDVSDYANNWTESGSWTTGSFSHGLTSLTEGELYYFRACAYNDAGYWGYGDEEVFLTKPDPPSTFTATSAGEDQIDLEWTNGDGSQKVYIIGKEDSAPSNRGDYDWTWDGVGTNHSHTGLSTDEHWYYQIWSYATEGGETQTSDTPDLTDDAWTITPPSVTSLMVEGAGSAESGCWVILRGQVTDDEELAIDTIGFNYGLTAGYGSTVSDGGDWNTGDDFVLRISGLAHGTTYHWRAFASAGATTGYGSDMVFTTEGSASLYEYWNTGEDDDSAAIYAGNWTAQYFTVDSTSHSVTAVRVYLKRVGSPGTVTLSIKHVDDSFKPTGADICSGTYDGDVLSTDYNWVEFTVDEASLEAETAYAIVVRAVAGDGSNYVFWGEDSGGGLDDAFGWHSTDGGVTWSSDSPVDYLFELWGYPLLSIESAAVFRGYLPDDDDDMLFAVQYINTYPPYYPDYDCPTYFSLRLYDTDGVTLLKSTACQMWGNMPGAIYVAGEEAASLTPDAQYYLKLVLNSDTDIVASYQLQSIDWKGDDLAGLDRWVITTAHSIETYYGGVELTEFIAGQGEVLNEEGGVIFSTGIPALADIRPDLFKVAVHTPGYEGEDWTNAFGEATDWETQVGDTVASLLTTGGGYIGMDGKNFGTWLLLGAYLIFALLMVGKQSREGGFIGAGLAVPILLMGTWLRLLDVVFIAVTASIAVGLLMYSLWWSRT